jgi:hypothetical protein
MRLIAHNALRAGLDDGAAGEVAVEVGGAAALGCGGERLPHFYEALFELAGVDLARSEDPAGAVDGYEREDERAGPWTTFATRSCLSTIEPLQPFCDGFGHQIRDIQIQRIDKRNPRPVRRPRRIGDAFLIQ